MYGCQRKSEDRIPNSQSRKDRRLNPIERKACLAKMDEETDDDPHGHITSLAVKRSHRR